MTCKLFLSEYSSFKISEVVGAHPPRRMSPYSELVEGHIHQSLCDDALVQFYRESAGFH